MKPKKILIVKPSALGDIIHTFPIASAIKKKYPKAHISWVVSRPFRGIVETCSAVDEIIIFDRKKWGGLGGFLRHFPEICRFFLAIRRAKYDIVFDFQGLIRTGLITFFSGSNLRIGFANAREFAPLCYNRRTNVPSNIHAIDRYRLLAKEIDLIDVPMDYSIVIDGEAKEKAQKWLGQHKILAIVAGAQWTTKRWPPEHFAQVINLLANKTKLYFVLTGAPNERAIGEKILQLVDCRERVIDLIGKSSLQELVAVVSMAEIVLSNDSGPMHLSVAMDAPTVGLFGPTDPSKVGPYGSKHEVFKENICHPKCKRKCIYEDMRCLHAITPEQVSTVIQKMLH